MDLCCKFLYSLNRLYFHAAGGRSRSGHSFCTKQFIFTPPPLVNKYVFTLLAAWLSWIIYCKKGFFIPFVLSVGGVKWTCYVAWWLLISIERLAFTVEKLVIHKNLNKTCFCHAWTRKSVHCQRRLQDCCPFCGFSEQQI